MSTGIGIHGYGGYPWHGHNGCMGVLGWAHLGCYYICTCATSHDNTCARKTPALKQYMG
jgi:hypothetical protein